MPGDTRMLTPSAEVVRVRDTWNGWRTAEVPRSELHDLEWLRPPGAPQPMLHARVLAAHLHLSQGHQRPGADDVGVFLLKIDIPGSVYDCLAREAFARSKSGAGPDRYRIVGIGSPVPAAVAAAPQRAGS